MVRVCYSSPFSLSALQPLCTAEQFDPDRFIDHRVQKYLTSNPFIFLPFNAGPRICLGQQFAYNEMSFFLIKLMQSFESFDLDTEALDPESRPREEWKGEKGRKGVEKMWPRSHLTLYIRVSRVSYRFLYLWMILNRLLTGWLMGEDGRGQKCDVRRLRPVLSGHGGYVTATSLTGERARVETGMEFCHRSGNRECGGLGVHLYQVRVEGTL